MANLSDMVILTAIQLNVTGYAAQVLIRSCFVLHSRGGHVGDYEDEFDNPHDPHGEVCRKDQGTWLRHVPTSQDPIQW